MFHNWQKASQLAKFEINAGAAHFLLVFFASIFLALFLGGSFQGYSSSFSVGFDVFFLSLFSVIPAWLKPKETQYKKVNGELWASHIFIMHKQLAIPEDILVKSRFIIHFVYTLPMLTFILCLIYPAFINIMSPYEYIAFSIIWLSFSIYLGLIMGASDAGDYVNIKSISQSVITIVLFFIISIGLSHYIFDQGIVHGSIILAKSFPFMSIIISIFLSIIGIKFWQLFMEKTIRQMDYF